MKSLQALIQDLQSPDASVRDKAAIVLMDIGDEEAVRPLLDAIAKPENANHTGTLVYALSAFDCVEHLEVLVDLCLKGNYEVSSGAFHIIEAVELTQDVIRRIDAQLRKSDRRQLSHESNMAFQALVGFTSGHKHAERIDEA